MRLETSPATIKLLELSLSKTMDKSNKQQKHTLEP